MTPTEIDKMTEENERLRARLRKLAEEKSNLQLIIRLIEQLNPLPGIDDMVRAMLYSIVDTIGGTNIKLYYFVEGELHYADFHGETRILPDFDDPLVARVAASSEFIEERGDAESALLLDAAVQGSWIWGFPLLVGKELIGVIKLENLKLSSASLRTFLPIFFSHAALLLSNEIHNDLRKKAEDALRAKSEELELFFTSALDLLCIADTEGYFRKLNPEWEKTLGYPLDQLLGHRFLDLVHPDDLEGTLQAISTLSAQNPVLGFSNRYRHKDGSYRCLEWRSYPVGSKIYAAARDITEHIRSQQELTRYKDHLEEEVQMRTADLVLARDKAEAAEHSLRESEVAVRRKLLTLLEPEGDLGELGLSDILDVQELQSLMDDFYRLTHMGCGIIDMNGKVLVGTGWQDICTQFHRCHPVTLKHCIESDTILSEGVKVGTYKRYQCKNNMWDMATPIVIGGKHLGNMFFGQFFFEDELPDVELFRQQAAHYGFDKIEYLAALARVPRWNRETIDAIMMFYSTLMAIISRLSYSTVKLARALTERDIVAEALAKAKDEAEAANRAKSAFLASMSHELRTPMNAILGFSSLMCNDPSLSSAQCQNLEIINRSGAHLLTLINDVLEMSKIEAGRIQMENAPFDLSAMVRDVMDMMEMRAREKGLQLMLDQSSGFPRYIDGDEARLRQILINLVGNAIKFTEQGGVTLRLGKNSQLLIEVEDSGPGISAEDQKRLFQPFVQLGMQADNQGTGLGLAITRQFVQLMNGSISLISTPGKGSLFRVELPLKEVEGIIGSKEAEKGDVIGLAPGQPEYRILIVEDQLENQLLLARLMECIGFPVRVADNGEQGVQLFQSWHPQLIWMDRRMPVMDGLEATKIIRALPGGKEVRIVAVTASVFMEQRAEMLAVGMDDFVRKPYRSHEIYDSLSRQLGVKYIYANAEPLPAVLTAEILAVLPPDLCLELRDALQSLEAERIAAAISKTAEFDAKLFETLHHLADNFDYPSILKVLQQYSKERV